MIAWLTSIVKQKRIEVDSTGDVTQIASGEKLDNHVIPFAFRPVAWRGIEKSARITNIRDIRPGDTLVFSPIAGGLTELGYLPEFNDWSPRDAANNPIPQVLYELDPYKQANIMLVILKKLKTGIYCFI